MSPTRNSQTSPKAISAVEREAEKALRQKYASILTAVAQVYGENGHPLTTAVLVSAGAKPQMVPTVKPFDEHGYYVMDWQLNVRWKNPWPSDEVRDDALFAARLEGVVL